MDRETYVAALKRERGFAEVRGDTATIAAIDEQLKASGERPAPTRTTSESSRKRRA